MRKQTKVINQNNIKLSKSTDYLEAEIKSRFIIDAERLQFFISNKMIDEKDINSLMYNLKWEVNCAIENYLENKMPAVLDQYKDYRMFVNTTEIKEYKPPKV
jgi:hypothetical protein